MNVTMFSKIAPNVIGKWSNLAVGIPKYLTAQGSNQNSPFHLGTSLPNNKSKNSVVFWETKVT